MIRRHRKIVNGVEITLLEKKVVTESKVDPLLAIESNLKSYIDEQIPTETITNEIQTILPKEIQTIIETESLLSGYTFVQDDFFNIIDNIPEEGSVLSYDNQVESLVWRQSPTVRIGEIENTLLNNDLHYYTQWITSPKIHIPFAVKWTVAPFHEFGGPGKAGIFWSDPWGGVVDNFSIKMGIDNDEISETGYTYGTVSSLAMKFSNGTETDGGLRGFVWNRVGGGGHGDEPVMALDSHNGDLTVRRDINCDEGQILSGGVNISALWGGGAGTTYTNATPMPEDIHGIDAGTTWSNATMTEVFDAIFYPYQDPVFTSFNFGQTSPLEVGATGAANSITFVWGMTNDSNVTGATPIRIEDATLVIDIIPATANDNFETGTYYGTTGLTKTSEAGHSWLIWATDTNSRTFSRSTSILWRWRFYYGSDALSIATESMIEGLQNYILTNDQDQTYVCDANNYKWICWPTLYGTSSVFTDAGTNNPVAMESPQTVSVTNQFGEATDYYAYRTTNPIVGEVTIVVG